MGRKKHHGRTQEFVQEGAKLFPRGGGDARHPLGSIILFIPTNYKIQISISLYLCKPLLFQTFTISSYRIYCLKK